MKNQVTPSMNIAPSLSPITSLDTHFPSSPITPSSHPHKRFNHVTIPYTLQSVSSPIQLNPWRSNHTSWYTNLTFTQMNSFTNHIIKPTIHLITQIHLYPCSQIYTYISPFTSNTHHHNPPWIHQKLTFPKHQRNKRSSSSLLNNSSLT